MQLAGFIDVTGALRVGVYALVRKGEVVYVGKSKAMLTRVATHRSQWAAARRGKVPSWLPVKGIEFDEVHVRPCTLEQIDALEREMINLYKPRHNELLKTQEKITAEVGLKINGVSLVLNAKPKSVAIERRV